MVPVMVEVAGVAVLPKAEEVGVSAGGEICIDGC